MTDTFRLYGEYRAALTSFEQSNGHFLETPNVRMHYLTWGSPKGVPLIYIHGTNGNAYEVFYVADSLVQAGYYIVAIDYYGHGLTPIPAKDVSLYDVADDIKLLMDKLKIKKAVIAGFSRGGTITTAFYDSYPDRVLGLILEDGGSVAWSTNTHKKPVDSTIAEYTEMYKDRQPPAVYDSEYEMFRRLYIRRGSGQQFKKFAFVWFTALKKDSNGKYQLNPGVAHLCCEQSATEMLTLIHRPFAASTLFGATSHFVYPKIIYRNLEVPMLIFDPVSDNDIFNFEKDNALLQESHPQLIKHVILPNTSHVVKNDRPSEYIREVTAFLRRVKS